MQIKSRSILNMKNKVEDGSLEIEKKGGRRKREQAEEELTDNDKAL